MDTRNTNISSVSSKIKELVQLGLLSALTFVATMAIHVPSWNGGVIHLGDSMIFLTAVIFGRKYAAISGAVGMTMFDILSGYSVWAPYTFVIKAVMGFIAGSAAYMGGAKGENVFKNAIGMLLAGIWMIGGYYAAEVMITGNLVSPVASVTGNTIQFGAGAVIAFVIIAAIKRTSYFKNR
ncbi:MAG TPA: ECF transporter S component [Clostridia bacterium]|nr:ECF transporter S component [Clostridia bacterium]